MQELKFRLTYCYIPSAKISQLKLLKFTYAQSGIRGDGAWGGSSSKAEVAGAEAKKSATKALAAFEAFLRQRRANITTSLPGDKRFN